MAQIIVGSVLGLAGAVVGAVVTYLLQRSQARQTLELERAKIFADRRLDAYVQFRRLARDVSAAEHDSAPEVNPETERLIAELRDAEMVIHSIGDPSVALAASRLLAAWETVERVRVEFQQTRAEGFMTAHEASTRTGLVLRAHGCARSYVDAVRSSFGVGPMRWQQMASEASEEEAFVRDLKLTEDR